jgi:hypothetical protein
MAGNEGPTTAERRIELRLTLGQAWGAIVALVAIVSGAFGFGWGVSSWISGGEIAKAQSETAAVQTNLATLQGKHDDLRVEHEKLKTKEGVLRLFYFYHLAKLKEEAVAREAALAARDVDHLVQEYGEAYERLDAEGKRKVDDAKSILAAAESSLKEQKAATHEAGKAFIALWAEEEERTRHLNITFAHLSKGGGGKGTIKFAYDDMTVQIPNEFLPVVRK